MSLFIAEHNLPYSIMNHLPKLIKNICPDSKIAHNLKCGDNKCKSVITNVLASVSHDNLMNDLKTHKFSIILDESTDRSAIKHLALVIRIVQAPLNIMDRFVTLIEVNSATSQALYDHVIRFFNDNNIPYKNNMIGYASDGANNMMGAHNSLATKLRNDIHNIFVFKCICHSFHLCASYACMKLPKYVEDVARDVYNYISNNPKRLCEYKEFQQFLNLKPHKLLHPAQTRWLSLHSVVKRILSQYSALKLYFTSAALNDGLDNAKIILDRLTNPLTLMYFEFLDFVLPFFIDLNIEMQSTTVKIHVVYDKVGSLYKEILNCYMKKDYICTKEVNEIQYRNPEFFLDLKDIYLGGKVMASITQMLTEKKLTYAMIQDFKLRCQCFYVEAANQVYQRFPFKLLQPLKHLKIICPETIFDNDVSSLGPMYASLPILFGDIDINEVDREWRKLPFVHYESAKIDRNTNIIDFWTYISKLKKGDETPMFPLMVFLVKNIMTLPHSSACVERIFSMVNAIKTKERNRLQTDNLCGLLQTKSMLKASSSECYNYTLNNEFLKKFNQNMYKFKSL